MRLLLIRHGETSSNLTHALDTRLPGAELTEHGRAQAADLPAALEDEAVEAIWASQALRAQQTAAPLARAKGLEVQVLPGMFEIQAGDLEMKSDRDSILTYIDVLGQWRDGDLERRMPGGENGAEVMERLHTGVCAVAESGVACAAVISHGAALRVITGALASNLSADFVVSHGIDNTGVIALEGDPDAGWAVRSWVGELIEPEQVTPISE